ncbi:MULTISPECIES: pentapeptide repeat-containing protein [unclassified Rickettsia]|uniref:pentapeptide repeat-containing protein n=1 Tax=unclassified Rickettsia TaxID=114295 RepID=UPI003132A6F6
MSKEQIDLNVAIEKISPASKEIEDYIIAQRQAVSLDPNANLTLNQYLKDKYFKDKNVIAVADLSNRDFSKEGTDKIIDLAGGDFSGVILKNTSFKGCDLSNALFCDVDFDNAYFEDTILRNIDFRGATLENCRFSENYKNYSSLGKGQELEGIKYSTTSSLGRIYADVKAERFKRKEHEKTIVEKKQELNEIYKTLTVQQTAWYVIGRNTGNEKYDKLDAELKLMLHKNIFPPKDLVMHASFQNIFSSEHSIFDPAYIRGSNKEEKEQEIKLVSLTREDVISYLSERKTNEKLSLNDFAKSKLTTPLSQTVRVVADLSSKIDMLTNNEWRGRVDLSGLDFTGADLSEAIFAGSILTNCKFENTNISKANFESVELQNASFTNVNADNTNFFNTNIKNAVVEHSEFTHAFMSRSDGKEVVVKNSNFDYANIKDGKWDESKLVNSTFNYANLEGISLISADLQKVKMQHAILDNAILTGCKVIECDLSNSLMNKVEASKAEFRDTILKNIEAKGVNLTEAELDKLVTLEGADLQNAILKRINAEGVNFAKANLDLVQAQEANLRGSILTDATAKFANFRGAIFREAKAQGVNLSYSNLEKVDAQNADFTKALMRRVQAENADFTAVNFTKADLTRSNLKKAILVQIQAGKAILDGVNLYDVKLKEANINEATIDNETNIAHTDITNIKGNFVQDGQQISPLELKNKQEKLEVENKKNVQTTAQGFLKGVIDTVSLLPPTIRNVQGFKELYDNFIKFQEVDNKLLSDKLLVEERKNLQKQQAEYAANLIKGAQPVLKSYQSILNNPASSDFLKDNVAQAAIIPVLNAVLTPILTELYTPEAQATGVVIPNMFDRVSPRFIRDLLPVSINLVVSVLEGDSNQKMQDIYKNLAVRSENSRENIIGSAFEILSTDNVQNIINDDLIPFLKDTKNQEEFVKIAQNAMDNSLGREIPKKLFADTVNLAVDVSAAMLASTPQIIENYQEFTKYQSNSEKLLTNNNLSLEEKNNLVDEQKESIKNILKNTEIFVNNISPILENNLTEYFKNNINDILKFLDKPQVQDRIRSYDITPEFAKNSTKAILPFMEEILPLVTKLTKNSLEGENKEKLTELFSQIQEVMNAHPDNQSEKVGIVVKSLISFKKANPEIEKILEKEIPELLVKHADTLGPVVEEFLNKTEMGKKVKIQGEKIIQVLGEHAPALGKIVSSYSKGQYGAMVRPIFELLADKKVLGIITKSIINLSAYKFQESFVPNKIRNKVIGSEMNKTIVELLETQSTLSDKQINLALLFHERDKQLTEKEYSAMFSYSLRDKNLKGLSFEKSVLKFDNFKVKGFNFDNTKFKECSFKGAILEECSFKGTIFNEQVNFEGATIDAATLTTLIPAIKKYNAKHPDSRIALDKVKIAGDVSKIDFSGVVLNNPEFIKNNKVELQEDKETPKNDKQFKSVVMNNKKNGRGI